MSLTKMKKMNLHFKKQIMKKLSIIISVILLMTACSSRPVTGSCDEVTYVTIVQIKYGKNANICWYKAKTASPTFNGQTLWFNDTIGKYKIGDFVNK